MPLQVLRARGIVIPDDDGAFDDQALAAKIREIVETLGELGMAIEFTDHLTDRELYRWLVGDMLLQEIILGGSGFWHVSPIGGYSEEDIQIHLQYYASDEDRREWEEDFGEKAPPKKARVADRDRFLSGEAEWSEAGAPGFS